MSAISIVREGLRRSDLDTVLPSPVISEPLAKAATTGLNGVNTAIYAAAVVGGPAVPLVAGAVKVAAAAGLCAAGYVTNRVRGSDHGVSAFSLGVSLAY